MTTDGAMASNDDEPSEDVTSPHQPSPGSVSGLPSRFGLNVSMSFVSTVIAGVCSVVVTPLLLHHLGELAYGVWALALSLAGYLEILEFGFVSACTRLMAQDARKRPEEVSKTLSTSLVVLSVFGLISLAVGFGIAFGAPSWFHLAPSLRPIATTVIIVMAIGIAISVPGDTFGGGLAAYQRYDLRSLSDILLVVASTGAIFALIEVGRGLEAIALAGTIISVVLHPIRWAMLRSVDSAIHIGRRFVSRSRVATLAKMSNWFLLAGMASLISYSADLIILGAVLNVKLVALYAIGGALGGIAQRALAPPAAVLLPEAAALSKDGTKSELATLLVNGTRTTVLLGIPVSLVMGILAVGAVRAWVGPGYDQAANVLALFSVYTGLRTVISPLESILIGSGRVRPWAVSMAIQGVVNVGVTLALVWTLGLVGPALGTVVATTLILGPTFAVYGCRVAEISVFSYLRQVVGPHLLPSAVMSTALVLARHLAERGRFQFCVTAVVSVLLYGLIYYLWCATPNERAQLRRMAGRLPLRKQVS